MIVLVYFTFVLAHTKLGIFDVEKEVKKRTTLTQLRLIRIVDSLLKTRLNTTADASHSIFKVFKKVFLNGEAYCSRIKSP